jgi:hypothetical protein
MVCSREEVGEALKGRSSVIVARILLCFSISLFFAGCSPVKQEEAFGTYRSNIPEANEFLELNRNGEYVHSFYSGEGQKIVNNGRWTFYEWQGERRIIFQGFQFALNKKYNVQRRAGEWGAVIARCGFSICIPVLLTDDYSFRKE